MTDPSLLLWTWPSAAPQRRKRKPVKEQGASGHLAVARPHTPALSAPVCPLSFSSSHTLLLNLSQTVSPSALACPLPVLPASLLVLNLTFQLLSDPPSAFWVSTDCFLPLSPHPPFSSCLANA